MSFAFMLVGLLATTNAGRVALAARESRPSPRTLALAIAAGFALIVTAAVFANDLLDALDISPESFRIAAGIVLAAAGIRTIVWPRPSSGPFAAILVTPGLACLAISFGADEATGAVLGAAAIALAVAAAAALAAPRVPAGRATEFLAALQVVIAVALVVSGVRDV